MSRPRFIGSSLLVGVGQPIWLRGSVDFDAAGSLARGFGDSHREDAVVEVGDDAAVFDVAGQCHLVVEASDGSLPAAEDSDAFLLLALTAHREAPPGDLNVEILLTHT